jgi:hypothetical protein
VADGIDAAVHEVQPSAGQSMRKRMALQPRTDELCS